MREAYLKPKQAKSSTVLNSQALNTKKKSKVVKSATPVYTIVMRK
jgi:hypothetical protein